MRRDLPEVVGDHRGKFRFRLVGLAVEQAHPQQHLNFRRLAGYDKHAELHLPGIVRRRLETLSPHEVGLALRTRRASLPAHLFRIEHRSRRSMAFRSVFSVFVDGTPVFFTRDLPRPLGRDSECRLRRKGRTEPRAKARGCARRRSQQPSIRSLVTIHRKSASAIQYRRCESGPQSSASRAKIPAVHSFALSRVHFKHLMRTVSPS